MQLAAMRERFLKRTSALASDFGDGEIDTLLNAAYQFTVPLDVGGEFSEQIWELALEAGTATYAQPATIVAIDRGPPWIEQSGRASHYLGLYSDPFQFDRYATGASPGKPSAMLVYGKEVTVTPTPGEAYTVNVPCRGGPVAELTDAGIEHTIHAKAVVADAAIEYLIEQEDADGVARETGAYARYLDQLKTYAHARPRQRMPRRHY